MSSAHETATGFYAALGLTFDAKPEQVKKSYHKKSLRYHPDRNAGDDEAKEKFQAISNAFAVLSDATKRSEYDAVFRMRCVLDQGEISSADGLRGQALR